MGKGTGPAAKVANTVIATVVLLASGAISYLGVSAWHLWHSTGAGGEQPDATQPVSDQRSPVSPFANGEYLIAFVLLSSDCGWSSLPDVIEATRKVKATLRAVHGQSFAAIRVVGVALDDSLEVGLEFLSGLGEGEPDRVFDQVSVGGGWLNEEIVRFVWRGGIAQAALPQIIVVERPVNTKSYLASGTIEVQDDRLLVNPVGRAEITQWLRSGVPLDWVPYRRHHAAVDSAM